MRSAVIPVALVVGAMVFALAFELNYLAPSSTTSSLSAMQSTSPKSRPETRGWLADVLRCVERCFTNFTLANIYAFESELAAKHPDNHNARAKIRQQLQLLRDLGFIEFLGSGEYRYVKSKGAGKQVRAAPRTFDGT